jgi:hypothetical protein
MPSSDRGQSSLEFLMTYGWVLLIILVALVVMWQWGLFTLDQRVEPGSFGFWGIVVAQGNDFVLDQYGTLHVSLINNAGANLTVVSCNVTIDMQMVECNPCKDANPSLRLPGTSTRACVIPPGQIRTLYLNDPLWRDSPGKRFDATILIRYNDSRIPDNIHQSSGRIWGTIETG